MESAAPHPFLRHGWNIATITATVPSSFGGASSATTVGSSVAHSLATDSIRWGSECSNSITGESQVNTPTANQDVLLAAQLDTIFSMDMECSMDDRQGHQQQESLQQHQEQGQTQQQQQPQELVCQLQSQASLPAVPHATASTLRYRQVGSDDGSNTPSAGHSGSPSSSRQLPQLQPRCLLEPPGSCSNSLAGSPKKRQAAWNEPGGCPPPSSAVFEPDRQRVLLPASLVQQYGYFPLVLVQLPMYNEEAHCEVVIERACNMLWPRHRVIIQVRGASLHCY